MAAKEGKQEGLTETFEIARGRLRGTNIEFKVRLSEIKPYQFDVSFSEHIPVRLIMKAVEKAGLNWGSQGEKKVERTVCGFTVSDMPILALHTIAPFGKKPARVEVAPPEIAYRVTISGEDLKEAVKEVFGFLAALSEIVYDYVKSIKLIMLDLRGDLDELLKLLEQLETPPPEDEVKRYIG
ncbi:hypothetical protein DRP04_10305 [Archaeoglobales archaeon]|nr:MAG: hypothetical protein DRP04_10305 [Archaeoglobales archaeon]